MAKKKEKEEKEEKLIRVKYEGKCSVTGRTIEVGELAYWNKKKKTLRCYRPFEHRKLWKPYPD